MIDGSKEGFHLLADNAVALSDRGVHGPVHLEEGLVGPLGALDRGMQVARLELLPRSALQHVALAAQSARQHTQAHVSILKAS